MNERDRYLAMQRQVAKIETQAMVNASQRDPSAFELASCYWSMLRVMNRFNFDCGVKQIESVFARLSG